MPEGSRSSRGVRRALRVNDTIVSPAPKNTNDRYRMDYMKFVNYHRETNADVTIGCIAYGSDRAKEFGLMKIDDKRRVMVGCYEGRWGIGLLQRDHGHGARQRMREWTSPRIIVMAMQSSGIFWCVHSDRGGRVHEGQGLCKGPFNGPKRARSWGSGQSRDTLLVEATACEGGKEWSLLSAEPNPCALWLFTLYTPQSRCRVGTWSTQPPFIC